MANGQHARRTSRFRTGRILVLAAFLIALGLGGRWFYYYQRDQNTLRLKTEAETAYAREDWSAAAEGYRLFLNREPFHVEALRQYAGTLLDRMEVTPQSVTEAARALRRLLQVDEHDIDAIERLTKIYFGLGEFDLAQQMAQRWLETAPGDTDAILALAEAHERQRRFNESASVLTEAISQRPAEPRYYARLVELYLTELNDERTAKQWLEKALATIPEAAVIQMAAFSFHRAADAPEIADQHLHRALSLAPNELGHLVAGARFYVEQFRLDEAEDLLDRASKLQPRHRRQLLTRAAWAVKQGTPRALEDTAVALEQHADDTDGEMIAQAAELFVRAGAFDRVDACLGQLRPLARRSERIRTWIEVLQGARLLLDGSAFEAVPHLENALRRNSRHLWTTELLALAYTRIGALDEAAELYRRVSVLTPGSAAQLSLAQLAWQQGRPDVALDHLDSIETLHTAAQRARRELLQTVCRIELLAPESTARQDEQRSALAAQLRKFERVAVDDLFAAELLTAGYVHAGAAERAVAFAKRVAEERTDSITTIATIGHALADTGSWSSVKEVTGILTRQFAGAPDGHVLTVRGLVAAGQAVEAERYIERLDASSEVKGKALAAAADALIDAKDTEVGAGLLRQAAGHLTKDIPVRRNLLRHITDPAQAQIIIDEIKQIEGDRGLHWRYERAAFVTRVDQTEPALREALTLLEVCLAARPGWTSALLLRGFAQESLGQLQRAADSYRTAMSQKPRLGQGDIAIRLVGILKRLGRFSEADALVATIADSRPDQPQVLRLQTERFLRSRRLASAVEAAEALLTVSPDDPNWAAFTADLQLRAGNASRAEEIAREALQHDEGSVALLWSLARALVAQEKADEAERFVHASATRRNDATQFLVLAQLQTRLGKREEASKAIDRALSIAPDDATINGAAADFWGAMGDRTKQLAFAKRSITLRGDDPAESLTMATLLAAGDTAPERAEARAIVSRRLERNDTDVSALILEAKLAASAQPPDLNQAEDSLRKALTIEPRSQPAHKVLAAVQVRSGRFNEARHTIEAGLSVAPNDPDFLKTAAELHLHKGEFAAALAPLRRLLELGAATPDTLVQLANAYRATDQLDLAIGLLQKRVDDERATPVEYATLAELLETTDDFDRSESLYQIAVDRAGADGAAFARFMNYLARRNQLDRVYASASQRQTRYSDDVTSLAIAGEILASRAEDPEMRKTGQDWLSAVIAQHPEHAADAAFRSGLSYYKRGELINAETMFMKAGQLAPRAARPANGLAWLYLTDRHRPEEALAILEQFFARGGQTNAEMLDTHAAILLRLDRHAEAKELLTRCLTLAGQMPTLTAANYRMGLVQIELGQGAEGAAYLRHALELNNRLPGLLPQEVQNAQSLLAR